MSVATFLKTTLSPPIPRTIPIFFFIQLGGNMRLSVFQGPRYSCMNFWSFLCFSTRLQSIDYDFEIFCHAWFGLWLLPLCFFFSVARGLYIQANYTYLAWSFRLWAELIWKVSVPRSIDINDCLRPLFLTIHLDRVTTKHIQQARRYAHKN